MIVSDTQTDDPETMKIVDFVGIDGTHPGFI
jgi:hypothetical protein